MCWMWSFFTDEERFYRSGHVKSQNVRLWSSNNRHVLHETPLHHLKVGVWVVFSRCWIVGPIFFMNTNSERYCLEILYPFIGQMTSDEINYSWFQQDGATAHTSHRSMQLLKEFFWRSHYFEKKVATTITICKSTRLISMGGSKICSVSRSSAHTGWHTQTACSLFQASNW